MSTRVLVIDNYDSFTWNLVQCIGEMGATVDVVRNDVESVEDLVARDPDRVVISPGPCTPADAGVSVRAVDAFAAQGTPVLGVCLGHQAIVEACGGEVIRGEPIHGKDCEVIHDGRTIYEGLPVPLVAGRYHSLVADPEQLPDELEVSSNFSDVIMGVRHRELPLEGVQFHPESVLTPQGPELIRRFIGVAK